VLEEFLQVCGRTYLEDIKRSDILDKFVGALQDRGLADRTVYHRFACLISTRIYVKMLFMLSCVTKHLSFGSFPALMSA
jgi:hypothetical protein